MGFAVSVLSSAAYLKMCITECGGGEEQEIARGRGPWVWVPKAHSDPVRLVVIIHRAGQTGGLIWLLLILGV